MDEQLNPIYTSLYHTPHKHHGGFSISMVIAIIIIIALIVTAIVAIVLLIRENQKKSDPTVNPGSNQCSKPISELESISDNPCCLLGGEPTALRFMKSINMTVGPVPTYYLDACAGFCKDGMVDKNSLKCVSGSNVDFDNCVDRIKPVDCQGAAFPVAIDGIQPFYAKSATKAQCTETGSCVPAGNETSEIEFENSVDPNLEPDTAETTFEVTR